MRVRPLVVCLAVAAASAAGCSRKPAAIDVTPKRVKLYGLERPLRLTGRVVDSKGQPIAGSAVGWTSSKPDVVTVDSSGRLLSKKEGNAVVTASFESLAATVPVQIVDVQEIRVTPSSAHLVGAPGTEFPLAATVVDSRGQTVVLPVTWTSSDEKVARVSSEGVVTTVGPGNATIIARLADFQGGVDLRVDPREIARVEVKPATALVRVGDSQHFEVAVYDRAGQLVEGASARFVSSDPTVASVDGAGVASGHKPGTATIRADVGGASAEAVVLVN